MGLRAAQIWRPSPTKCKIHICDVFFVWRGRADICASWMKSGVAVVNMQNVTHTPFENRKLLIYNGKKKNITFKDDCEKECFLLQHWTGLEKKTYDFRFLYKRFYLFFNIY